MTTDFSAGAIPAVYRDIFEICSNNGEPVQREVYQALLNQCKLDAVSLKTIWNLAGPPQGDVNRTNLYKTLALVAWAQQGKVPTEKLFENYSGKEYPLPQLGDMNPVRNTKLRLQQASNPAVLGLTYAEITAIDTIGVELVPEKKGLFLKHSEYVVTSHKFNSKVTRRYNDFVALYELLLARFPYRIVPRLPPKKIMSNSHFLESRRRGLHRWLTLVCRHPTMCHDQIVAFFLTDNGADIQYRIRDIYRRTPDEFMTSDLAATAKDLLPPNSSEFATNREQVRTLVQIVGKIKYLADSEVERVQNRARDSEDLATQLKLLGSVNVGNLSKSSWTQSQKGLSNISSELLAVSYRSQQHSNLEQITVCERLGLLLDMLVAHRDLCERLEKGIAQDHETALANMLSLKKRKIRGVLKGTDGLRVEDLEAKMLAQENIISNIALRSDFSLYCVHMETQLVHSYLETMTSILKSMVSLKIRTYSELTDIWKQIMPIVESTMLENHSRSNGTS